MIVDASVVIDAVVDSGSRGETARRALAAVPVTDPLIAPGHFAIELMSGLVAVANRPGHPFSSLELAGALTDVEAYGITIEATGWADVRRAWDLSRGSLRYSDAIYIAMAERHASSLLTADGRIGRSGSQVGCSIITV